MTVPAIDAPRYRSSTVVGLLTWVPKGNPCTYRKGKKFGNWSVDVMRDDGHRNIFHYSTLMLSVTASGEITYAGTGHGSVSDQGMMNRLFRALGSDFYFSRKGGAAIVGKDDAAVPSYLKGGI